MNYPAKLRGLVPKTMAYPPPYPYGAPVYYSPSAPVPGYPSAPPPLYAPSAPVPGGWGAPPPPMHVAYRPPPSAYYRMAVGWQDAYDRRKPFMVPYGMPPDVAHRMYRASEAFRASDRDFSGNLDPAEFKIVRQILFITILYSKIRILSGYAALRHVVRSL